MKLAIYFVLSFITLASALPSIPYLNKRLAEAENVTLYNSTNTETAPTVPVVLDVVLLNGTSWISTRERFWAVESGGDEFAITDTLHSLRSIDNVLWSPILDNIERPRLLVLDEVASQSLSKVASDVSGISAYWTEAGSDSNATVSGSFYPTNVTTNSSLAWNTTSNQTNTSSTSALTEVNSLILTSFGLSESFVNHSASRLVVVGAAKPALTNVSVLDSSENPVYQTLTNQSTTSIRREVPIVDSKVIDVFGYNFYFLALSSSISFLKSFAFCNQTSAFSLFQDIASCGLSGQLSSSSCFDGNYYSLFGPTGYFATGFGSSADVVVIQSETNCNATVSAVASNTTYVNVNSYVDLTPTLLTNSTYNSNLTNSSIPPIPYTIINTTSTNTTAINSSNSSGVGPLAYYGSGFLNISDYLNTEGDGHVILKGSGGSILGDFYILNYTSVALGDYLIPLWW